MFLKVRNKSNVLGEDVDEDTAEEAMDYALKIVSLECTVFVWKEIRNAGLEPVVNIKAIADIIDGFDTNENIQILVFLVEEKWILRYGDKDEEDISNILKKLYKQISISSS